MHVEQKQLGILSTCAEALYLQIEKDTTQKNVIQQHFYTITGTKYQDNISPNTKVNEESHINSKETIIIK